MLNPRNPLLGCFPILLLSPLTAGQSLGTFGPPAEFNVGVFPMAVATGDFNHDGIQDLAVVSAYPVGTNATVHVVLGNGSGGYTIASTVTLGIDIADRVAVADFDHDGNLDLVVSHVGSVGAPGNQISILFGDGLGGLSSPMLLPAGTEPRPIAIADFDADGNPDIAVGHISNDGVAIYLGDGAGGFSGPTFYGSGGGNVSSVSAGDIDDDGILDLVAARNGQNVVSIFLGDGSGAFAQTGSLSVPGVATATLGDLNGDGDLDLVAGSLSSDSILTFLGNGAGSFAPDATVPLGTDPWSVEIGDVNGDGHADVAVVEFFFNQVAVLFGDGTGGLGAPFSYASSTNPLIHARGLALARLDSDSFLDLAVANSHDVAVLTWQPQLIGGETCASLPNSTGAPAEIEAVGSSSVSANDLVLRAYPVPNTTGMFIYSQGTQQVPWGNGNLCLASPIFRQPMVQAENQLLLHGLNVSAPLYAPGQIFAGSTWSFQAWFRDPAAGGAAFNSSDALAVTFVP